MIIDNNCFTETIDAENDFKILEGDSLNNDVYNLTVVNTPQEIIQSSLEDILASIKIDPSEEILPPKVAWEQVATYGENPIMGTLGNISTIIGKAKSRKSFLINMMVATMLKGGEYKGFNACLPSDKRHILYFDTEQSKYHVQLAVRRICEQVDDNTPTNLTVYPLRTFNPALRLGLIEEAIKRTPNLGLVVIDGIRDVVTSINDEEQATDITSKLMKWSEENEIHIACVLHQNKNDTNARGHIGTELINKSETVLSVTVDAADKAVSVVEAEFCRNIAPERFAFEVIDNLPEIVEDYKPRQSKREQQFDLFNLSDSQRCELLDIAFMHNKEISYADLVSQLQVAVKKHYSTDVGQTKVKTFITYCRNNQLISQEKERSPYIRNSVNNLPYTV